MPISRLSSLFRDPYLRRVFERTERDQGPAPAVSAQPKPVLPNGDIRQLAQALESGDVEGALKLALASLPDIPRASARVLELA